MFSNDTYAICLYASMSVCYTPKPEYDYMPVNKCLVKPAEANMSDLAAGLSHPLILLQTISEIMWRPACYLGNRVLQNSNHISDAKAVYRLSRNAQLLSCHQHILYKVSFSFISHLHVTAAR